MKRSPSKPLEVRLVWKGHVLVAEPLEPVPPLTNAMVNRILQRLRDRNYRRIVKPLRKPESAEKS